MSDDDLLKGLMRKYTWLVVIVTLLGIAGLAFLLWLVKVLFFGGE